MIELWIIGAGGHAKVVADTARSTGEFKVMGVVDDDFQSLSPAFCGVPVIGPISSRVIEDCNIKHAVIAIGDNRARAEISRRFSSRLYWQHVVHSKAYIASDVAIGGGTVICAGAVIQPSSCIGDHVIINTSSSVDHDSKIENFAHIGPGARVGGEVSVGAGTLIGVGTSILSRITIGEWSVIGAGAAVVRDVPAKSRAIGVPASASALTT